MVSGLVIALTNLSLLDIFRFNPPPGGEGKSLTCPVLLFRWSIGRGFSTLLSRRERARRISAVEGSWVIEIVGGVRVLDLLVEAICMRGREYGPLKACRVYGGGAQNRLP